MLFYVFSHHSGTFFSFVHFAHFSSFFFMKIFHDICLFVFVYLFIYFLFYLFLQKNGKITICPEPWLASEGLEDDDQSFDERKGDLGDLLAVNSASTTSSMTASGSTNSSSLPTQASTSQVESMSQASLQGSISTYSALNKTSATTTVSVPSIQPSANQVISVSQKSHQRAVSTTAASASSSSNGPSSSRTSFPKSSAPATVPSASINHSNPSSWSTNPASLSNSSSTHISASNQVPNQRRSAPSTVSSPSDASLSDSASDVVEIPAPSTASNSSTHHKINTTDALQPNSFVSRESSDQARQLSSAVSAPDTSYPPGNLTQSINKSGGVLQDPVACQETDEAAVIPVSLD